MVVMTVVDVGVGVGVGGVVVEVELRMGSYLHIMVDWLKCGHT